MNASVLLINYFSHWDYVHISKYKIRMARPKLSLSRHIWTSKIFEITIMILMGEKEKKE